MPTLIFMKCAEIDGADQVVFGVRNIEAAVRERHARLLTAGGDELA